MIRNWIVVAFFALALVGFLYIALHRDSADVTMQELVSDPQTETANRATDEMTVDSVGDDLPDLPSSEFEPLDISWRELPYQNFPFPNGSPSENYLYYRSLAESGNGFAAYQLAEMMRGCSDAFNSREELDSAIEQMRQTGRYFNPELHAIVWIGDQADINAIAKAKTLQFENCQAFTIEQRHEHSLWLELAVNNGYTLAMVEYGQRLDDPQVSLELYRTAWQQGSAEALLSLAEGLEQIYDDGIDPTAKVPAYAARHAFVTLLESAYGSNPERVVGRWTLRNRAQLDEMAKEMRPAELAAAVELSRQMISSNENCCFAM
jgi:hypothetical protein